LQNYGPFPTVPAAGKRDDSIACGHIPWAIGTGNLCCPNREFMRRNRDFAGPGGVMQSRIAGALRRRSSAAGWAILSTADISEGFRHIKAISKRPKGLSRGSARLRRHAAITPASGRSLPSSSAGARLRIGSSRNFIGLFLYCQALKFPIKSPTGLNLSRRPNERCFGAERYEGP